MNKIRFKINELEKKKAWTTAAHECVLKYNEIVHTVTKFSPKYLMEGTETTLFPKELEKNRYRNLEEDRKKALQNIIKYDEYNKKLYDEDRIDHEFKVGDMVYVENGNRLNRRKLDELRIGPFAIKEKISKTIFRIDTGYRKEESNLFHYSKLIPTKTG